MIRNMLFHISVVLLIIGCGKYEDSIENPSPNNILVEVETPQTNGWSTEEIAGTRSGITKTVKHKGEYDLNMEVSTLYYPAGYATDEAATRWANMEDNITFRVIAYKSATATEISTANYAGYGDYKLLGSSVQTTKSLILPMGTYTFIVYSYGNSSAITTFTNSSTSVPVTNGQNFMTYVKAGVVINNTGSKYTLSNIVFKHHCARYRVQAIAQAERMGIITACTGTVTLPKHNATYSFTNNALTAQAGSGTINITWSSPNAMSVYSNYTYLLPQTSASVTIKLNLTIGNKPFSNRSTTLSGVTLNANNTYYNNVSFTTTEGYIIGGNIWANGNLYYTAETKKYGIYPNTLTCSKANNAPDYFVFNNPLPNNPELVTTWSDSRDPCRKVEPNSTWRTPTLQEFNNLLSYAKGVPKDGYTIYGDVLKLPYSSFMRFTDGHPHEPYFDAIGYYLCTTYNRHLQNEFIGGEDSSTGEIIAFVIRCVRNK